MKAAGLHIEVLIVGWFNDPFSNALQAGSNKSSPEMLSLKPCSLLAMSLRGFSAGPAYVIACASNYDKYIRVDKGCMQWALQRCIPGRRTRADSLMLIPLQQVPYIWLPSAAS